jgi:hypothetical protein
VSPVERIDGPFLMRHEDLACAPVELLKVAKAVPVLALRRCPYAGRDTLGNIYNR